MYAMQYYTGDGWQWVSYGGLMPVAKTEAEFREWVKSFGWEFHGTHRVTSLGQSFQYRIFQLAMVTSNSTLVK